MAVLTLALGIGSVTAIFSLVYNVLWHPFPYPDADKLLLPEIQDLSSPQSGSRQRFFTPEFLDLKEQNHVFDEVIALYQSSHLLTHVPSPEAFVTATVTPNAFRVLGIPALLGRLPTDDDVRGGAQVMILSSKIWRRSFGGDPSIIGKTYILNDTPTMLVAVMPPRFAFWNTDFWLAKEVNRSTPAARRFSFIGHLKPGVSQTAAQADLQTVAGHLAATYPYYPARFRVITYQLTERFVGDFRTNIYTLLAAVTLLLLIACGNAANILLVRAVSREKEFLVRAALGATRGRLAKQTMVENLVVALASAVLGCGIAYGLLHLLTYLAPRFTFPDEAVLTLNLPVLGATLLISVITAFVFGSAATFYATRRDLAVALRSSGRSVTASGGHLQPALVVTQVALSFSLLTGAGLMIRSFEQQRHVNLGFNPVNLIYTQTSLPVKAYPDPARRARFIREVTERIARLPEVTASGASTGLPPIGGISSIVQVAGRMSPEKWTADLNLCTPGYFGTIGIKLLEGQLISDADASANRRVAVVNEAFSRKYLAGAAHLGQRVKAVALEQKETPIADPWFDVIGVVSDVKNEGVLDAAQPEIYVPCSFAAVFQYGFFARAALNQAAVLREMEQAILTLDRNLVPQFSGTVDGWIDFQSFSKPRFSMMILVVFAAIGLILASIGVYGVVASTLAQKTREVAIRLALGAPPGRLWVFAVSLGLRMVMGGLVLGLAASWFLAQLIQRLLWRVSPQDPGTLAIVSVVLLAVGLAACHIASRPAMGASPSAVLRLE